MGGLAAVTWKEISCYVNQRYRSIKYVYSLPAIGQPCLCRPTCSVAFIPSSHIVPAPEMDELK